MERRIEVWLWATLVVMSLGKIALADTISFTDASRLLTGPPNGATPQNAHAGAPLSWGDFDGDGKSDFLVSAPGYDTTENVGLVYLVRGSAVYGNPSALETIAESVVGTLPFHQLGDALDGKGDINGDGKDDVLIGSPLKDQLFVIFGSTSGWGTLTPVTQLAQTIASSQTVQFSRSISHVGDINGDGIDDLLVGAPQASSSGSDHRGKAYVYFGRISWTGIDDATDADIVFTGVSDNDQAGSCVAILPDINGDGIDDLAIGSAAANGQSGRVYLFFGRPSWSGAYDLSAANLIGSGSAGDQYGSHIVGIPDMNGDKIGDFVISAPGYGSTDSGAVNVYLGSTILGQSGQSMGSPAGRIVGSQSAEGLGVPAYAGDVDGDGNGDLLVGSPHYDQNVGRTYLFSAPVGDGSASSLARTVIVAGNTTQSHIGTSVSTAGDISENGIDAWLVGAPFFAISGDDAGRVGRFASVSNSVPSNVDNIAVLSADRQSVVTQTPLLTAVVITATATDPDAATENVLLLNLTTGGKTRRVKLRQAGPNTANYYGTVSFARSADQPAMGRYSGVPGNTVTIAALNGSDSTTLTLTQSTPRISGLSLTQVGNGTSTLVRVDYVLTDLDQDLCQILSGDLEFATANQSGTPNWQTATVTGSTTALVSSAGGVTHNANFQPFYWQAGGRDGTVILRLRVRDTSSTGSYVTSNTFTVDNTVPTAPVLSTPSVKNTFEITVTGSAEPLTTATIYVAGDAVATGTVSAVGLLSVTNVPVSATRNTLSATITDAVGLVSATSNSVIVSFGSTEQTLQSGTMIVTVNMPLGAAPSDDPLAFDAVSTASLQTQLGDPPQYYAYMAGFNLGFSSQLEQTVTFSAGVATVNLQGSTFSLQTDATVYYWNGSAWAQTGITANRVSSTDITFTTTHFSRFAVVQLVDGSAPVAGPILLNGTQIATDNYYLPTPTITVTMSDPQSGIASWSIELVNVDTGTVVTQNSAVVSENQVTITLLPDLLSNGRYQVRASAQNHSVHTTSVESGPFTIQTEVFSFEVLAGPNPLDRTHSELTIGYSLSQNADVDFVLFDLRGRQLKRWKYSRVDDEGQAGYHKLFWDLRDPFGDDAVNGLYQLYAIAQQDTAVIKRKLRVALLR